MHLYMNKLALKFILYKYRLFIYILTACVILYKIDNI